MNWGLFGRLQALAKIPYSNFLVQPARGKKLYTKRGFYNDKILQRGLLPRIKDASPIKQIPAYEPKNSWSPRRALFGQNDYIDILGDGALHPAQLLHEVPAWLRGFRGNEYQVLLRRIKLEGRKIEITRPKKYSEMRKRMKHLYFYLNKKTDTAR